MDLVAADNSVNIRGIYDSGFSAFAIFQKCY